MTLEQQSQPECLTRNARADDADDGRNTLGVRSSGVPAKKHELRVGKGF